MKKKKKKKKKKKRLGKFGNFFLQQKNSYIELVCSKLRPKIRLKKLTAAECAKKTEHFF